VVTTENAEHLQKIVGTYEFSPVPKCNFEQANPPLDKVCSHSSYDQGKCKKKTLYKNLFMIHLMLIIF